MRVQVRLSQDQDGEDEYVKWLNGIYGNGFVNAGVTGIFREWTFVDPYTVEVTKKDGKKTKLSRVSFEL